MVTPIVKVHDTMDKSERQGGVVQFASYRSIVESMIKAGWIRLQPGEFIAQTKADEQGVTFYIEGH